ncbi:MAG: hypothetical protein COV30_00685 [Candidatus Yanofskybacteria bacterium CG10_big_fil_rev_8_21_14_0_10_37_15]|uniref:SIS domain-containing protein n=1 Tax=Candidatus Yanofskybacteria bacterium CG10_big_fil_rev_8_21_14_0_10_37_15 TaxID=1975097 RepID=A0A2H0R669_9BACT|nr:MAG: hypothetical protein COV30_00685 [Candidatus Yanofskybacteria bacterium CG10_big_fil_rev_8_21_14_0_10_37_15]
MNNYLKTIKTFFEQFAYEPEIINKNKLIRKDKAIIAGMGGSRLAGDILRMWKPDKEITIHSDYGLPLLSKKNLDDSFIIANSFSGNTEEIIDVAMKAVENNLSLAIVATGGKLLDIAKENNLPYIQIPSLALQPRMSLGYSILALLKILGDDEALNEAGFLKTLSNIEKLENQGREISEKMKGKIPLIYTSERNNELGYVWKIVLNETAKTPAFCNRFPELNHNEIAGFENQELSKQFHFLFLRDADDDITGRIGLRMNKLKEIFSQKDLSVTQIELNGESHLKKIFSAIILAYWTAYYLADQYEVDPEKIEIIENFKRILK